MQVVPAVEIIILITSWLGILYLVFAPGGFVKQAKALVNITHHQYAIKALEQALEVEDAERAIVIRSIYRMEEYKDEQWEEQLSRSRHAIRNFDQRIACINHSLSILKQLEQ